MFWIFFVTSTKFRNSRIILLYWTQNIFLPLYNSQLEISSYSLRQAKYQKSTAMKHITTTPSFLPLPVGESQSNSTVEWSTHCNSKRQQHQSSNIELFPSPSILSTETWKISTASSVSSSSCSSLSCISSSESSSSFSIGSRAYDDTDDTTESTSINEEDDAIISLGALSLDTPRVTAGVTTTLRRTATLKTQEEKDQQGSQEKLFGGAGRAMSLPQDQHQHPREPPIESLNPTSSFEKEDSFAQARVPDFQSGLFFGSKKGQQHSFNSLEIINIVPSAHSLEISSVRPASFPKEDKHHQHQRRATGKKYTIKTSTNKVRHTVIPVIEAPTVERTKRERGGSDFTMASASSIGGSAINGSSITSPLNRRKRRRINRNHAMAADDFDSILSQINIMGSFWDCWHEGAWSTNRGWKEKNMD